MIKKLFVLVTLTVALYSYGQEGSVSPYSFYGTGEQRFRGTMENRMMGGMSVYSDSIHLNLQNPASLSKLRLTTFNVAGSYNRTSLKSDINSETASNVTLDYFALGFPLGNKAGVSMGLYRNTAVGYRIADLNESGSTPVLSRYLGDGGVNRVFVSFGFEPIRNLSIGATGNFNFGNVENELTRIFEDIPYGTQEISRSEYSGFDFNVAMNYRTTITDRLTMYSSAIYAPSNEISSSNFRQISTIFVNNDGDELPIVREEVDLRALGLNSTYLNMAESYTLGLGVGQERKWFLGAEYQYKKTSNFENEFLDLNNGAYEDYERFSAGGFFIPDYDSFTSYWKRVVYRVGVRNEQTGLIVNNVPVYDFGMTFGLGLPLGGFSSANVGFEFGKRGSTFQGRVEDNYFNLNISLSLSDRWFVKSLIN
ncbi:hypothetical protein [Robertkochia aurantiaca]|uniref:hypothetical protein n=1 Tax=Robertkochia aurantiaca TaxID=2873700 RepID=UPI001CCA0A27|nr:hypothetical protein [Robertkochia sp. 3YJGBD-33]